VTPRPDSLYPLIIDPYKLNLSQYTDKVIREKNFDIYNNADQPLELSLVATATEYFSVDLPERIDPGQTVTAQVVIHEDKAAENFSKSLTFEVNDEKRSRYTVPITRNVRKVGPKTPKAKATKGG